MKGGIEHGDLRDARHDLLAGLDAHQVGGIVQRAEGDAFGNRCDDVVVNQRALGKFFPAVHDAVPDGADLFQAADNAVVLAGQLLDDGVDRLRVGRQGNIRLEFALAV